MPTSEAELPGAPADQCGAASAAPDQTTSGDQVVAEAVPAPGAAPADLEETPQLAVAQAPPAAEGEPQEDPVMQYPGGPTS
eukprot:491347-Lingulodinium_polyedra.AAC.1